MSKTLRSARPLSFLLAAVLATWSLPSAAFADASSEARKAQILANLVAQFPQLEGMGPVMGEIKPSGIPGLDEGSFTVGGRQTQVFHVTADNKKLWMVSGQAIDVSQSAEQLVAAKAEAARIEEQEALLRAEELEKSAAGLPFRGKADAPVTIVEFSDFQCPYCSRGAQLVEDLLAKHPNDIKFVFKHRPLEDIHPWAMPAAIAASCAAEQKPEAFWILHDAYFKNQKELNAGNLADKTREFLAGSGIDLEKFAVCSQDPTSAGYQKAKKAISDDVAFGSRMGAGGTPAFFIGGHFINGIGPLDHFEAVFEQAKTSSKAD